MIRPRVGLIVLGLVLCVGCSDRPASQADPDGAVDTPDPHRVVVLAPAAAEMLEALDLLDRVVGIGDFGPWPESITDRPSLGGYDSPNVELALELRADLVLTASSDAAIASHQRMESLGIRVISLDTSTYRGVFDSLERVGRLFAASDRASRIARQMRESLGEIEARASSAPARRVLFVVGRDPLYVAGPGSHIDEMIRLVGGENVAHDAVAPYQQVSLEAILERVPDVIIDTSDNRPGAARGRVSGDWSRWNFVPAVRDDRVYQVDPGKLVIPGLRLPEMTRLMGKLAQPEIFGEVEPTELE
jgi:ABC-type Fe3+-hydroxamate transport system substrate-binding protein